MMLLLALLGPSAHAQEGGFDAHVVRPLPLDGDLHDPIHVRRPHTGDTIWFASGVIGHASDPVVFVQEVDGERTYSPVLDQDWLADVSVGGLVHPRVRVEATVPFHLSSRVFGERVGLGFGDLRAAARVNLVPADEEAQGLAVDAGGWLDLPTGDPSTLRGNMGMAGGASVATTWGSGPIALTSDLGLRIRPDAAFGNVAGSETLQVGGAVSWAPFSHTAGVVEVRYGGGLQRNAGKAGTESPAEALVTLKHRHKSGAIAVVGAGMGFGNGVGASDWRVFVGGGIGRAKPAPVEVVEVEVEVPVLVEELTPAPATARIFTKAYGDRFGGAVVSLVRPESEPEIWLSNTDGEVKEGMSQDPWTLSASYGDCLRGALDLELEPGENIVDVELDHFDALVAVHVVDHDGEPIANAAVTFHSDAARCVPDGAFTTDPGGRVAHLVGFGDHTVVVRADGFAPGFAPVHLDAEHPADIEVVLEGTRVEVTKDHLETLEEVYFELNSAVIDHRSDALLAEIAAILKANPNWGRMRVEGHADSSGGHAYNLKLSQERADSVMQFLVDQGVVPDRLEAVGYGEERPVTENSTDEGRALNRRVDFHLLDIKP